MDECTATAYIFRFRHFVFEILYALFLLIACFLVVYVFVVLKKRVLLRNFISEKTKKNKKGPEIF